MAQGPSRPGPSLLSGGSESGGWTAPCSPPERVVRWGLGRQSRHAGAGSHGAFTSTSFGTLSQVPLGAPPPRSDRGAPQLRECVASELNPVEEWAHRQMSLPPGARRSRQG